MGYGAGAGLREGSGLPQGTRDTRGVPQTVHRKRRRREEKTFHSGSREESRVRWNGAKSASQGDLPKGAAREGGQPHARPEGLLGSGPMPHARVCLLSSRPQEEKALPLLYR